MYNEFLVITPEILAGLLAFLSFREPRRLDPEISELFHAYSSKFTHHEDETNLRREIFSILAMLNLRNEIVLPWLIMITSLLAALIEGKHRNRSAFLAVVAAGIILLAIDVVVSRGSSRRNFVRLLHVITVLVFVVLSVGVKLEWLAEVSTG